ncbi:hypothetical protein ElyMa_001985300 [Elysia marginata]|uniref:Uncharacterized protein n=1 Tax=Elysia marginata TaxID=1093978 RepID=A0AAV4F2R6_9GAST|nr:hypothetical protein ElyMa_001985300 [Elysia marginata]
MLIIRHNSKAKREPWEARQAIARVSSATARSYAWPGLVSPTLCLVVWYRWWAASVCGGCASEGGFVGAGREGTQVYFWAGFQLNIFQVPTPFRSKLAMSINT